MNHRKYSSGRTVLKAFLLAVLVTLFWGAAPMFDKLGLAKISPTTGLAIRSIFIMACMCAVVAATGEYKEIVNLDRKTIFFIACGAALSGFVGQLIYFHALKIGQPSKIVPVVGSYPLIAAILSVIIFKEPATPMKIIGAALVVGGVLMIKSDTG